MTARRARNMLLLPSVMVSVGVLALNDHLLKRWSGCPSVISGKLSDFAGLYAAPFVAVGIFEIATRHQIGLRSSSS